MGQDRNQADRLGGEYMIQDRDHMSETGQMGDDAGDRGGQQSEQSQGGSRQQGDDQQSGRQQGGEQNRRSRLL
jgi:hypothetical protein